jgi:hypothetical protein
LWDTGNWSSEDIPEDIKDLEDKDDRVYQLSEYLKEMFEERNPLTNESSLYSDLMGYALGMVDWYELAENLLETVEEEENYTP